MCSIRFRCRDMIVQYAVVWYERLECSEEDNLSSEEEWWELEVERCNGFKNTRANTVVDLIHNASPHVVMGVHDRVESDRAATAIRHVQQVSLLKKVSRLKSSSDGGGTSEKPQINASAQCSRYGGKS